MSLSWKLLVRLGGAIGVVGAAIMFLNFGNRGLTNLGELVGFAGLMLAVYAANKRQQPSRATTDSSDVNTMSSPSTRYRYYALGVGFGALVVIVAAVYLNWKSGFVDVGTFLLSGSCILAAWAIALFIYFNKRS